MKCPFNSVKEEFLIEKVKRFFQIQWIKTKSGNTTEALKKSMSSLNEEKYQSFRRKQDLTKRVGKLTHLKKKVFEGYIEELISKEEYQYMSEQYQSEIDEISVELTEIQRKQREFKGEFRGVKQGQREESVLSTGEEERQISGEFPILTYEMLQDTLFRITVFVDKKVVFYEKQDISLGIEV